MHSTVHTCPFTPHGRDWLLYRGTPGLGEVWQLQPALPAEKGTPGGSQSPCPHHPMVCIGLRGHRGPGQSRPRLPSESQNTRTLSMVLATAPPPPPPPKLIIPPQPSGERVRPQARHQARHRVIYTQAVCPLAQRTFRRTCAPIPRQCQAWVSGVKRGLLFILTP